MGTALKILYSEKLNIATESGLWDKPHIEADPIFRLKRSEIVALFNAFGRFVIQLTYVIHLSYYFSFSYRLSNSIYEMENFRKSLR